MKFSIPEIASEMRHNNQKEKRKKKRQKQIISKNDRMTIICQLFALLSEDEKKKAQTSNYLFVFLLICGISMSKQKPSSIVFQNK